MTAVTIPSGGQALAGDLTRPAAATGVIVFAHGSGSSRHSPRNRYVAGVLQQAGFGTLLMDLLTLEEERVDALTGALRFDVGLLAGRCVDAIDWLAGQESTRGLAVGCFGASTGAAAALLAAAERPQRVGAVVSRGGRPDLAGEALPRVAAPTLLLVGSLDTACLGLNRQALAAMTVPERDLVVIPGATHLFEEPGTLEVVARLAAEWFGRWLSRSPDRI